MNDIAPEMSSFAVEAIKDPSQPYPFFKLSPDIHPDKLNQQQKELLNRANVFLQIVNDNLQIFRPFTDVKIPIEERKTQIDATFLEKTGKKYIAYIDRIKDEKIPLDMRYERLADEEDIVIPIDNESLAKLEDGFSTARHEISTVMTSILGYSQLLSRRDNPKYRDNIVANLAVFSQLYTELPIMFLDSVKIENISIKNLQELISENIKSVSPSIIPHVDFGDIEFETGDVRWAPIYIRRLAANIIQNADREGATEMDITAEILPADAVNNIPRRFAVHFTDNGTHGIDDTILRYGFQKNTSKHLSGVLGDGNAMAGLNDRLTMINEHGGISIAKRPDGKSGARVTATFPL